MDIASDECLPFRAIDDTKEFGAWYPSLTAMSRLKRNGHDAIPGVAEFLMDCPRLGLREACASDWLLAFVAEGGDHEVLAEYEKHPYSDAAHMRACIHGRRHVAWRTGASKWACEP